MVMLNLKRCKQIIYLIFILLWSRTHSTYNNYYLYSVKTVNSVLKRWRQLTGAAINRTDR